MKGIPALRILLFVIGACVLTALVLFYTNRRHLIPHNDDQAASIAETRKTNREQESYSSADTEKVAVVVTNEQGLRFSVQLPQGWQWDEGADFVYCKRKSTTATLSFDSKIAKDDKTAEAAARDYLSSLNSTSRAAAPSHSFVSRVEDRRIIMASGTPAVWDVITSSSHRGSTPYIIETQCVARFGEYDITIWSTLTDLYASLSPDDVAAHIADSLSIVQSLHIECPNDVRTPSLE